MTQSVGGAEAHLSLSMTPYKLAISVPAMFEALEFVDSELSGEKDDDMAEHHLKDSRVAPDQIGNSQTR